MEPFKGSATSASAPSRSRTGRASGRSSSGMQRVDKSRTGLAFRMDDRKQRLVVARTAAKASPSSAGRFPTPQRSTPTPRGWKQAGVKVDARHPRARRRTPRRRPDRLRRSGRQPPRNLPRRRDHERAVQARPQHLGLPHRPARHGPRGAARQRHQRRDPVLSRPARLPAVRLHDAAVQRLFLPRQSAPPFDRLHRDRPQRHAPSDGASCSISTTSASATTWRSARKAASASRSAATSTTR